MSLSSCATAFIIQVLCGNSVLKSTFKTFLNSQILLANAEIALLAAQIARLDILNAFANLEIQTLAAVQNKIQSSLNVVLGPMQGFAGCPTISQFMVQAQSGVTAKALAGFQNLIYSYNRRQYVANTLTARVKQLQAFTATAQEFLNSIDTLCP
jgi:hypothetical protein